MQSDHAENWWGAPLDVSWEKKQLKYRGHWVLVDVRGLKAPQRKKTEACQTRAAAKRMKGK